MPCVFVPCVFVHVRIFARVFWRVYLRVAAYTCVTVYALREYCTDMCRSVHLSLNGSDKEVLQIEAHTNKITRRRPRQGQTKTDDRMRHMDPRKTKRYTQT